MRRHVALLASPHPSPLRPSLPLLLLCARLCGAQQLRAPPPPAAAAAALLIVVQANVSTASPSGCREVDAGASRLPDRAI